MRASRVPTNRSTSVCRGMGNNQARARARSSRNPRPIPTVNTRHVSSGPSRNSYHSRPNSFAVICIVIFIISLGTHSRTPPEIQTSMSATVVSGGFLGLLKLRTRKFQLKSLRLRQCNLRFRFRTYSFSPGSKLPTKKMKLCFQAQFQKLGQ